MSSGFFITLEGIDGSGKSTQASRLVTWIQDRLGRKVVWTREPGGWGDGAFREMLVRGEWEHPYTELFLFMADRCEHARRVILPALEGGCVVLCERYQDSTLAYQSYGMGLSAEVISLVFGSIGLPVPDLTLWLDIPPEEAMRRLGLRGVADRIESRGLDFFRRVREGYDLIALREPHRVMRISASKDPDTVFDLILGELVRTLCS